MFRDLSLPDEVKDWCNLLAQNKVHGKNVARKQTTKSIYIDLDRFSPVQ